MQHLIESLRNLGLSEKEAQVYLALLQLGTATPYRIAKKSGLKRPTAYVIAEELVEKRVITRLLGEEPRQYIAKPVEMVLLAQEAKLIQTRQVLPELKSLTKAEPDKVRTLYFEGPTGFREALHYRMKDQVGKTFVGFYAAAAGVAPETLAIMDEWIEDMRKHQVHMKGLVPKHAFLDTYRAKDAEYGREFKAVPYEKYSSNSVSIDTMDDMVRIIDSRGPLLQAVIIENPRIAATVRQIFQLTWEREGLTSE